MFTAGHPTHDSLHSRNALSVDGSLAREEALLWSQKVLSRAHVKAGGLCCSTGLCL